MQTDLSIFRREVANRHFELTGDGRLFLPKSEMFLSGCYEVTHYRGGRILDWTFERNLVVNEGLNHVLDVVLNGGSQVSSWYIGLFEGNYSPTSSDTAANIASNATESTAYDETARQAATFAEPSGQNITNGANKAVFTMNATKTIYGALLISDSTKGGSSGTLISASKFAAARSVIDDDTLSVAYTMSAAAA